MRGTDAHWPFVFLLWFFVSSFPPTLSMGTLCTACLSPSPQLLCLFPSRSTPILRQSHHSCGPQPATQTLPPVRDCLGYGT